jgi:hypothetical protein
VLAVVFGSVLIEAQAGAQQCEFATYRLLVDGPGLATPIDLQRCSFADFLLWAGVLPRSLAAEAPEAPDAEALGPRYDVRFEVRLEATRTFTVRQTLYPVADGGPWTFTPPGQRFWNVSLGGEFLVRSGWFRAAASARPLEVLRAKGLPVASTIGPAPEAIGPAPEGAEPGGGPDAVWISFAALVVLALGVAALRVTRGKRATRSTPRS